MVTWCDHYDEDISIIHPIRIMAITTFRISKNIITKLSIMHVKNVAIFLSYSEHTEINWSFESWILSWIFEITKRNELKLFPVENALNLKTIFKSYKWQYLKKKLWDLFWETIKLYTPFSHSLSIVYMMNNYQFWPWNFLCITIEV